MPLCRASRLVLSSRHFCRGREGQGEALRIQPCRRPGAAALSAPLPLQLLPSTAGARRTPAKGLRQPRRNPLQSSGLETACLCQSVERSPSWLWCCLADHVYPSSSSWRKLGPVQPQHLRETHGLPARSLLCSRLPCSCLLVGSLRVTCVRQPGRARRLQHQPPAARGNRSYPLKPCPDSPIGMIREPLPGLLRD